MIRHIAASTALAIATPAAAGVTAFKGDNAIKVTMSYVVGGYMRQGGETLAPLVDKMMGDQLARLKAAAEAPMPVAVE